ncbi:hypothetical protein VUR80DRAFT_3553 [Thermomyces stellatus]
MEPPPGDLVDVISSPIVRLEVGRGGYYTIRRETLAKFKYFRTLMLINPALAPKISIDANQDVFHHIVAYLRRGTYPLVIDAEGRHDISTYLAILEEAKHFELDRLAAWIEEGGFAEAAKIECTATIRHEADLDQVSRVNLNPTVTGHGKVISNISQERFVAWGKRFIYQCPRGLHDGDRAGCGRKCKNVLGNALPTYNEIPTLRLVEVKKDLVIDPHLCRDPDW